MSGSRTRVFPLDGMLAGRERVTVTTVNADTALVLLVATTQTEEKDANESK